MEIGAEEHDGHIRFYTGSGNMAVSCMRNASDDTYRNRSFIVDEAMGRIPRSTERISSLSKDTQRFKISLRCQLSLTYDIKINKVNYKNKLK